MVDVKFAVVDFFDEEEVAVVPKCWLTKDQTRCYWPLFKSSSKRETAVKQCISPNQTDFRLYNVRVVYETDNYVKAREKMNVSQFTSDLQTEEEGSTPTRPKRKIRPNTRYESESEEEQVIQRRTSPRKHKRLLATYVSDDSDREVVTVDNQPRRSPRKRSGYPSPPPPPRMPSPPPPPPRQTTPSPSTSSARSTPNTSFGNLSSTRTQEFQMKLLTSLEQIKYQVKTNTKLLQTILHQKHFEEEKVNYDDVSYNLPLNSFEEVDVLETALEREEINKQMISVLSLTGGDTLKQAVRRVMAKILDNELATKFNWLGKGEKRAFSALKLKKVVVSAVCKTYRNCSEKEVEDAAKDWLRFSKDRAGGRKRRRQDNSTNSI